MSDILIFRAIRSSAKYHWRRFGLGIAAVIALALLWFGQANPWSEPQYVAAVDAELDAQTRTKLVLELSALAKAAGITAPVALNEPFDGHKLNIHIVRGDLGAGTGELQQGDARYETSHDVLLLTTRMARPLLVGLEFGNVSLSTRSPTSIIARRWFQFVVLHELGHRALHRGVDGSKDRALLEQEADVFAFQHLGNLELEQSNAGDDPNLFSSRVIAGLPPADRRIALTASTLQMLSVGLLFSDVAFSSLFSDRAHSAFVRRFAPYLASLLPQTTTREARAIVLLALAYLDRVRRTGETVTAEIHSDRAISMISYVASKVTVEAKQAEANWWTTIDLPPVTGVDSPLSPAILTLDNWAKGDPPPRVDPGPSPSIPGADDLTRELIAAFGGAFENVEFPRCDSVRTGAVKDNTLPIAFACNFGIFLAWYDLSAKVLRGEQELYWPNKSIEQQATAFPIDGESGAAYLAIDTSNDGPHNVPFALQLFKVGSGTPRLLAEEPLVTDAMPTGSSLIDWFRVSHPAVLSCDEFSPTTISCLDFLDSRLIFDLKSKKVTALIYPAAAYVTPIGDGRFVAYVPGGYHAFVVQPQ